VFADGSGLSGNDRVSCNTFVRVLARAGKDSVIYKGLAVAGKTGTLKAYLRGTPAEGVMRAKTGTLQLTRALSGFFPTQSGAAIEFSFIVNGSRAKARAESLWDDLARAFSKYPEGPPPADIGPRPVELS
jgi:D-alanyl-D-alanine carboxypeptidase/D-alanyl-D-alanine-endopeptidase (penicillin-binding protein 4)